MSLKVKVQRNEDSGLIELGAEDDGHFVALATMPATQFDASVANLREAAGNEEPQSS
jgi:hypothetical protein